MDLISKLRTTCTPPMRRVHPVYKRRFRPRGLSRRKRLEVVVEKPDKPLPFETPFVRTGARGRLLAETQNRFSQNPWPALPPFLSIPYLFTPFFPLFPERWTRLFPLFPPLFFFRLLFIPSFASVRARSRMRHPTRPHRATLTSIQINRALNLTHAVSRTIKGIINFTFVARHTSRLCEGSTTHDIVNTYFFDSSFVIRDLLSWMRGCDRNSFAF